MTGIWLDAPRHGRQRARIVPEVMGQRGPVGPPGPAGESVCGPEGGTVVAIGADGIGAVHPGAGGRIDRSRPAHSCAARTDGTAWCWGAGGNGLLDNGSTTNASRAVPVIRPVAP